MFQLEHTGAATHDFGTFTPFSYSSTLPNVSDAGSASKCTTGAGPSDPQAASNTARNVAAAAPQAEHGRRVMASQRRLRQ